MMHCECSMHENLVKRRENPQVATGHVPTRFQGDPSRSLFTFIILIQLH